MVAGSFRCVAQLGLIYLYNPKVGYRTIQHNLLAATDNAQSEVKTKSGQPQQSDERPFVENIFKHSLFGSPELRAMTCFAVVRNPFTRILSGYLNKIVERKPVGVWRRFAAEHGLDEDATENKINFIDFLRIIETECDESINPHFRPQYLNLMMPFSCPHFVGRLENFVEVENFLAARGVPKIARKGKVTNSSGRLQEFYTAEAEAIVAVKFADDFRLFGYSPRLSDVGALLEPQWQADRRNFLMEWLADRNFPADQLDPAPRAYVQFRTEDDRGKSLEIIRGNFARDDNTERLRAYARKARQYGETLLAKAIEERVHSLANAWRERVEDSTIFVPAKENAGTRSERRALRLAKRGSKRKAQNDNAGRRGTRARKGTTRN
jgi:hypothetical protein